MPVRNHSGIVVKLVMNSVAELSRQLFGFPRDGKQNITCLQILFSTRLKQDFTSKVTEIAIKKDNRQTQLCVVQNNLSSR